jgi:hypothetical protein
MEALRAEGSCCFKVRGGETMMVGLPDIIVCAEGHFIGLETKNPEDRNKMDAHVARQHLVHERIIEAGGHAQVVTSAQEALKVVRGVLDNE